MQDQLVAQGLALYRRQGVLQPVVAKAQPEERPGGVEIMIGHALLAPMRVGDCGLYPTPGRIQISRVPTLPMRQRQVERGRADIGDGIAGVFGQR